MGVIAPFPIQYIRQQAAPIDVDTVFATTAERVAYLTNPRRYAGMVVTDLEEDGTLYTLNAARNGWNVASGGGGASADIIQFKPGDGGDFPAPGGSTYNPAGNILLNKKVLVFRNFTPQWTGNPGDGNTYITKTFASNILTFSPALTAGEFIIILVV